MRAWILVTTCLAIAACTGGGAEGLAPAQPANTTVKFDFFHRPLPEIPLPNDIATRYDATSATGLRINASMIAPTGFERTTRELIDQMDGWGVFQPVTVPFTGPLDVASILAGHRDVDYDPSNDVVYIVNVDPDSPRYGALQLLDLGNGNYPVVLEDTDKYWKNDPRGDSLSLMFEETDEDLDGDGVLDPGEDTDGDGLLDAPNYLPGHAPARDDLAGRADALMTFYERQTNTLILRVMEPLDERTTYAVVITRRLLDAAGDPVGSPFEYVHHTAQTEALRPLFDVLPAGLAADDVAFAFTFTTQSIEAPLIAARDGLYGHGVQAHIASEFPAEIGTLETLRDADEHPNMTKPTLMYGEDWLELLPVLGEAFLGMDPDEASTQAALEAVSYVDYYVVGSYQSPQLFARRDEDGNLLDFNRQSWPPDLDRVPATATPETVYFTLAVPRKEVSARGAGQPAPLVILGHGYTGNRFAVFELGAFLVKRGFAVLAIDGPSHGISLGDADKSLALSLFGSAGLRSAGEAILTDRAFDQNRDGVVDSGADFWTSYLFHTRDVVRQFALDYMQMIRILRAFDGDARWSFDIDGDGQVELAGDFDADGVIDVGGTAPIYMTGGSLGGIMSMVMGGAEPEISAIAPIAGGGGYLDIGFRSRQGGVPEAFFLAGVMGPIYTGTIDADSGEMLVETIVADLNRRAELPLASVSGVAPGDVMVVDNLSNGERGCGVVDPGGLVRAAVESDRGDATRIEIYTGASIVPGSRCELDGGTRVATVETYGEELSFQGETIAAGTPLVALGHGLGRRRAHPDLRRMQGIGQLVLDPGDPVVYAPHLSRRPLVYPGTGQSTGAHALIVTTLGDMNVPAGSGVTYARAAGIVSYTEDDPRFGMPVNQVLIDNHVVEAVHTLGRYTDGDGNPVHLDVENFSGGDDIWGESVPRIDTPLRIGMTATDPLGGTSAAIFPLTNPEGEHGFSPPGELTDRARAMCRDACEIDGDDDPCGCAAVETYDIGNYLLNMIAAYFAAAGAEVTTDRCLSRDDCDGFAASPAFRDAAERP